MTSFEEITGRFPDLWQCLKHARKQDHLAHAFLICAGREDTRESFALALARLAACREAGKTGEPCGHCFECRKLADGTYPELRHLAPVGKMYQIQVGDRINPEPNTVRYFENSFSLTDASGSARKIGIIHDADRMNAEAQNALLKTLEEPPPGTLLLLTTGNPSSLLPTTRSRCQILRLPESRTEYTFPGNTELFAALYDLFYLAGSHPGKAEAAALKMITVSAALKDSAEDATVEAWKDRIKQAADFDPAMAKRLEKQRDAESSGAYMRLRKEFLSAIQAYAGEVFLLSMGAAKESLPNPELPVFPPDGGLPDAERAERMQRFAEELLFTLRFNVNEELALRDFALRTAMGG